MQTFIIVLVVLLILFILFIIAGIAINKRNLRKDKHDLLNYFKKHKDRLSITIKENGIGTLTINSDQRFPLASTLKILIAFNFVKSVTNKRFSINDKVELDELDKFYIANTDGDAHPRWKKSINNSTDVSLMEVAKGMMQFSSNACTDFLINKIGVDTINDSLELLQMDSHDQITYLTPPVLMPGYLSDKKKVARQPPMDLLLLADPSREIVDEYLEREECFIGESNDRVIGVYVILPTRPETVKLVNVAVTEDFHGRGIGKMLVIDAIQTAKEKGYRTMEVGTGKSSIGQLALYQKCGFRITGVDIDFFIRHYDEEIIENESSSIKRDTEIALS